VVEALPYFFLMFVLKIPTVGMIWLVLWAAKPVAQDSEAAEGGDEGGGSKLKFGRPIGPRRGGPHGGMNRGDCGPNGGRRRQAGRRTRSRERLRSRPIVRK
jgi:hypothetical protein